MLQYLRFHYLLFVLVSFIPAPSFAKGIFNPWRYLDEQHTDQVDFVAISSKGEYVASGGWDGKVVIWDVQKAKAIQTLAIKGTTPTWMTFLPDTDTFLVVHDTGRNFLFDQEAKDTTKVGSILVWWDWKKGKIIKEEKYPFVFTFLLCENGKTLVTDSGVYKDDRLFIRDASSGKKLFSIHRATRGRYNISPNGKWLAFITCPEEKTSVTVINLHTRKVLYKREMKVSSLTFSRDSSFLLAGYLRSKRDSRHRNTEITNHEENGPLPIKYIGLYRDPDRMVYSKDGKYLFVIFSGSVQVISTSTFNFLNFLCHHHAGSETIAMTADGKYLAVSGGKDNACSVWRMERIVKEVEHQRRSP